MTNSQRVTHITTLVLLVVSLLILLPTWIPPNLNFATLDGGYRAVLNDQSLCGLSFGIELVTTAGPLGFLRNPDFWPGRYAQKISWDLLLTLAFAATSFRLLRQRSPRTSILYCVGLLLALALIKFEASRVTVCLHVLYLYSRISYEDRVDSAVGAIHVVALSLASWVLFTHFLLSLVVIGLGEALYYVRQRRVPMLGFLYLGCSLFWWLASGQKLGAIVPYIKSSLQVAAGYVEVMLRAGGFFQLIPLGVAFAVFAIGILLWEPEGRSPAWQRCIVLAATGAVFFISYRSAFVRFEALRGIGASVTVSVMSLLMAFHVLAKTPRQRRTVWACLVAYLITFAGAVNLVVDSDRIRAAKYFQTVLSRPGTQIRGIVSAVREPDHLRKTHEQNQAKIRRQFPLHHIEGPVGMHGNLQGIMIANGLQYVPRPVFQSFDAYTPFLTQLNGYHVRDPLGPARIVVELQRLGGFPEGLMDADAWLAIFEDFEIDEIIDCRFARKPHGILVIKRKEQWSRYEKAPIGEGSFNFGETITIPPEAVGSAIWVEIDDQKTLLGRLGNTFLKLPRLSIEMDLKNSKNMRFKFSTAPGRGGFLLSPQVRSVGEMGRLMEAGLENAPSSRIVTGFRIHQDDPPLSLSVRSSVLVKLFALQKPGQSR